jgi:hypothetical protein
MKLTQYYLTKNDCYKAGRKIKVKGLMLHSTGANNTKLSRYINPDDGVLGDNPNNNDWNRRGISKCVHGFIGKDKNGTIRTYQTLPWDHRGWHAGGKANDTHIGVEICEDDLTHDFYFNAVYQEAVELFAYLCKKFNLTEKDIIDHSEGRKKGIASNHGDVMHWFPKYGKSMNTFRADVKALLNETEPSKPTLNPVAEKSIDELAKAVINGAYGSGEERKKRLGSSYDAVQKRVNELLGAKNKPEKTISQLADEVLKGLHGSGRERMLSLGSKYSAVQAEVNRRLR